MADCDMTLDLDDPSGDPVDNGAIGVAPAVAAAVPGGGKLIAAEKLYALSDPYNVEKFIRGQLYRWREYKPKGATFFAYCPDTANANYSALVPVVPVAPGLPLADFIIHGVLADPDSASRELVDELFADTVAGTVTGAAVGALINNNADVQDALGEEAETGSTPLGSSIQGAALVAALIYGGK